MWLIPHLIWMQILIGLWTKQRGCNNFQSISQILFLLLDFYCCNIYATKLNWKSWCCGNVEISLCYAEAYDVDSLLWQKRRNCWIHVEWKLTLEKFRFWQTFKLLNSSYSVMRRRLLQTFFTFSSTSKCWKIELFYASPECR